jgi:hypothetical protein
LTVQSTHRISRQIDEALLNIHLAMADLWRDYLLAHDASLTGIVHDTVGRPPGHSDPTGTIVTGPLKDGPDGQVIPTPGAQAALRKVLEGVPKKLVELENDASAISRGIRKAMKPFDPPDTPTPTEGFPRTLNDGEHARLKELQAKRRREGIA